MYQNNRHDCGFNEFVDFFNTHITWICRIYHMINSGLNKYKALCGCVILIMLIVNGCDERGQI